MKENVHYCERSIEMESIKSNETMRMGIIMSIKAHAFMLKIIFIDINITLRHERQPPCLVMHNHACVEAV